MGDPASMDIRQAPVIGNWLAAVGAITAIGATPCNPDPYIYVLATWYATPQLIVSLLKPDRMDLVGKRWGIGHSKRTKRRMIQDQLIGPEEPLPKGKLAWAVFRAQALAQKVGYFMLVADAFEDAAVVWTSTVYQLAGCQSVGTKYVTQKSGNALIGDTAGLWRTLNVWNVLNHNGWFFTPTQIQVPAGDVSWVGVTITVQAPGFPLTMATSWQVRIRDSITDEVIAKSEPIHKTADNALGTVIYRNWLQLAPERHYTVDIIVSGGAIRINDSRFWAYGDVDHGLLHDP